MAEKQQKESLQRERAISEMSPLERSDGLGSLDSDTAKVLQDRKNRKQRRHAPTTNRLGRSAYRQRMDDYDGNSFGSTPRSHKTVEVKQKVKVHPPPPGQCAFSYILLKCLYWI